MKITVYMLSDENTRPRGFGFPPKYALEVPAVGGMDVEEFETELPEGYEVARNGLNQLSIFDSKGRDADIVDHLGRPALIDENGYAAYLRLTTPGQVTGLANLRKQAGMTQQELADAIGIRVQNLSAYERGERSVSKMALETADAIAKVLGVHAEDIL